MNTVVQQHSPASADQTLLSSGLTDQQIATLHVVLGRSPSGLLLPPLHLHQKETASVCVRSIAECAKHIAKLQGGQKTRCIETLVSIAESALQ